MKAIMNVIRALYGQDLVEDRLIETLSLFYFLGYYVSVQVVDERVKLTCWRRPDYLTREAENAFFDINVFVRRCSDDWELDYSSWDEDSDSMCFVNCHFKDFDLSISVRTC